MTMSRVFSTAMAGLLAVALIGYDRPAFADGSSSHVRVIEPQTRALVAGGTAESSTFRALVDRLDSTPLLVFVRCRTRAQQSASAAGLEFLTSTPTYRYVRVFIRCDLPGAVLTPLLAHELQHALEVGEAPEIVDTTTLRAHYERIGYRSSADDRTPSFDTAAAIDVQRRVAAELAHRHSSTVAGITIAPHVWQ